MDHTIGTKRQAYRLQDDIYQTTKTLKLLLLMEKGERGLYKDKSLNEINLNDNLLN